MQEEKSYSLPIAEFSYISGMPETQDDVRQYILEQSKASKDSKGQLAKWSKAIGRNHAYLFQFITKKTPRKLDEALRVKLAKAMAVAEQALIATEDAPDMIDPDYEGRPESGIREIDVRAGMGSGEFLDSQAFQQGRNYADPVKAEAWHFPSRFMREEIRTPEDRVLIAEARGDSMEPTLRSGDRVIIDTDHKRPSPDGIYALRDIYGEIVVKRLQLLGGDDPPRVMIISDNTSHKPREVGADEITIVGRVLWSLKRL